jgi:hypothetical protein
MKKASLLDRLAFSFLQIDQFFIYFLYQVENDLLPNPRLGTENVAAGFSLRKLKLAATIKNQR